MPTDIYMRAVVTVIAISLAVIAWKLPLINVGHAQSGNCGSSERSMQRKDRQRTRVPLRQSLPAVRFCNVTLRASFRACPLCPRKRTCAWSGNT